MSYGETPNTFATHSDMAIASAIDVAIKLDAAKLAELPLEDAIDVENANEFAIDADSAIDENKDIPIACTSQTLSDEPTADEIDAVDPTPIT